MKYITLIIFIFCCAFTANAQFGFNHLTAKGGIGINGGANFEIGYETNKKYNRNWSIFFSGYARDEVRNWTTGLYYEPSLLASKNNLINLKIGTSLGTNEDRFIIDAIVGLEYNYAFSRNMKFTIFFKNNRMFNSDDKYRHAILIGLKHRL